MVPVSKFSPDQSPRLRENRNVDMESKSTLLAFELCIHLSHYIFSSTLGVGAHRYRGTKRCQHIETGAQTDGSTERQGHKWVGSHKNRGKNGHERIETGAQRDDRGTKRWEHIVTWAQRDESTPKQWHKGVGAHRDRGKKQEHKRLGEQRG